MTMQIYTITRTNRQNDSEFAIRRRGLRIGSLDIHRSGYCDWCFYVGEKVPSETTQRRLVKTAYELRAEG